jgi:hypothetical protein
MLRVKQTATHTVIFRFLLQEYQAAKTMALSFGTEEGSIYFQRDSRSW